MLRKLVESNKENKPLLLFFTGSDWCGWCIKLQNEVLKTADFKKMGCRSFGRVGFSKKSSNARDAKSE
jgi:thioredoxin-related protein